MKFRKRSSHLCRDIEIKVEKYNIPIGASKLRTNWTTDLASKRLRVLFFLPTSIFTWGESNTCICQSKDMNTETMFRNII